MKDNACKINVFLIVFIISPLDNGILRFTALLFEKEKAIELLRKSNTFVSLKKN